LGYDWAKCYDHDSPTRKLIEDVMDRYYLVNVVYKYSSVPRVSLMHSDFHQPLAIFHTFASVYHEANNHNGIPNGIPN